MPTLDRDEFLRQIAQVYESGDENPEIGPFALNGVVLENERLHCLVFNACQMKDVAFIRCDLRGSDLSRCSMSHVLLFACMVNGLSLPSGANAILVDCSDTACVSAE